MKLHTQLATLALGAIVWAQASACVGATDYQAAVIASNPTYYWTFDEDGIVPAVEQIGGNPLDVFTPSASSAKIGSTTTARGTTLGQALDLNNAAETVWNAGDLSGDAFTGAWAYEIWINSANPTAYQYILGSQSAGGFNNASILQYSTFAADPVPGTPHIFIYQAGTSFTPESAIQLTGWHHWVFVALVSEAACDVYQDGVYLGKMAPLMTFNPFPARELRAGGWSQTPAGEDFTGQIDELAIYDLSSVTDLTAKGLEIAAHYRVGLSQYNQAVLANYPTYYWNFDEEGLENAQEQIRENPADVFAPSAASAKTDSATTPGGVSMGKALDLNNGAASVWNAGNLSGPAFTGAWAYELWINTATPTAYQYILGSDAGSGYNLGSIMQFHFTDSPRIMVYSGGGFLPKEQLAPFISGWHHWVFVSHASGSAYDVYRDGALVVQVTGITGASMIEPFVATQLRAGGWNAGAHGENFTGQIDELAIYDLSGVADLSAKGLELARHFNASALTPLILVQPQSQTVAPGATATFTVVATVPNAQLLDYQWQKNGVDIVGADTATLTLNSVTEAEAGQYRVLVSSFDVVVRVATSLAATLTVVGQPAFATVKYPGISVFGSVGFHYRVEYESVVNAGDWKTLEDIPSLPTSPYLVFDAGGFANPTRFYRAVLVQ